MLIPTKHENLSSNTLVVGAEILHTLKKSPFSTEDLFLKTKNIKKIGIDQFYNTLTFLWLIDAITIDEHHISLKKADVFK